MTELAQAIDGLDLEIVKLHERIGLIHEAKGAIRREPAKYADLVNLAEKTFGDSVWQWLTLPITRFDGHTPLQAVAEGRIDEVKDYLYQMRYGVYA